MPNNPNPQKAIPLTQRLQQAVRAYREGRRNAAEVECLGILKDFPEQRDVLLLLAQLHLDSAKPEQSLTCLKPLLQRQPLDADAWCESGRALLVLGRTLEAEPSFLKALSANPQHFAANRLLGSLYERQGQIGKAEINLRQARQIRPDDVSLCRELAVVLHRMGLNDEAERLFRTALALQPDYLDGLLSWAKMEEGRGQLEQAMSLLQHAMPLGPEHPIRLTLLGQVQRRQGELELALQSQQAVDVTKMHPASAVAYYYEYGTLLDRMGRYAEAFSAFSEANRLKREALGMRYNDAGNQQLLSEISQFFTQEKQQTLCKARPQREDEEQVIFIVGFPRSGTTMVEQILSSHPAIAAGDEIHALAQLAGRTPHLLNSKHAYPRCLDALAGENGKKLANRLRQEYLHASRLMGIVAPGKRKFTDKTPLNETHLGLIAQLFPESPIIHVIRHPLDVVLSSHFNDVRHGDHFATTLVECARHYARTMDLVLHATEQLELKYLSLHYEAIVNDVESHARELLAFVEEPWDPCCIDFHLNKRKARTASYAQVTEKVYTRSLERYRNYRPYLDEVLPILEPYIRHYGYTVESI